MKTDKSQGTFEAILKGHSPAICEIAVALRRVIGKIYPECVETPRIGEGCTTYGIGPRKMMHAFACIGPHADHVNLGLYHGAVLSDPNGILEGAGKGARHVKIRDIGDVSSSSIKALILAGIAERRVACGESSKFLTPP